MSKLNIPAVPLALGLGGLIPFWALAVIKVAGLWMHPLLAGIVLALYAATILSFLGGARWGLATAAHDKAGVTADFIISVLPQLVGWLSLALPDRWRLSVLALAILILAPLDQRLVARGLAPPWFGRLRLILSVGAGAALFLGAFG